MKGVCGTHRPFDLKLGVTIVETKKEVIDKLSRCSIDKMSKRSWCIFICESEIICVSWRLVRLRPTRCFL